MSSSSVYRDINHCVKQTKKIDQTDKTVPVALGTTWDHHPDLSSHCLTYCGYIVILYWPLWYIVCSSFFKTRLFTL